MLTQPLIPGSVPYPAGSRSRRAALTFLSAGIQQAVQAGVAILATPIIVRGLGGELYGAWAIVQQVAGYLSLGDLRSGSALKLTLSITQHDADYTLKRRVIGASLAVWVLMLPLLLACGAALVVATPSIIPVSPDNLDQVRAAMALAALNVCLSGLLSLPGNVLRGMNLEYKAMGLSAFSSALSGLLSVMAIALGLGLPGVAASMVVGVTAAAVIRLRVACEVLPWLGLAQPSRVDLRRQLGVSWWVLASNMAYLLLNSTDILIVGRLLDARTAAVYVATGLVLRLTSGPIAALLSSGGPGIADLWGRRWYDRVVTLRRTLQATAVVATVTIGVGVVLLNRAFVDLWLGPGYYAGEWANLLMVLATAQAIISQVDLLLLDCAMDLRRKTLVMLVSGLAAVLLALILAPPLALPGIALGFAIGRGLLTAFVLAFVSGHVAVRPSAYAAGFLRPGATAIAFLAAAFLLAPIVGTAPSWLELLAKAAATGCTTVVLFWMLGLSHEHRQAQIRYLRTAFVNTRQACTFR